MMLEGRNSGDSKGLAASKAAVGSFGSWAVAGLAVSILGLNPAGWAIFALAIVLGIAFGSVGSSIGEYVYERL